MCLIVGLGCGKQTEPAAENDPLPKAIATSSGKPPPANPKTTEIKLPPINLLRTPRLEHSVINPHLILSADLHWSPDSQWVAWAKRNTTIMIIEAASGRIAHTLSEHDDQINEIAWSPDGQYLASASGDRSVIVWRTDTWKIFQTHYAHANIVECVVWSPDSRYVASGSWDKSVIIWDVSEGRVAL